MALCTLEPSILFAHPSLDAETTLPRNAELLFVVAGSIQHAALVWLPDGERSVPRATIPFDRYRIDAGDRLTPGSHRAELGIAPLSGSRLVGPETYPLRFHVADVLGPAPDASGSVAISRVLRYWRRVGGILRADLDGMSAALDEPGDCSAQVSIQAGCGAGRGWSTVMGDHRVELEAEGSVLGFALDDRYFLPASCRSAFVPGTGPFSIRVVTETGLGSPSEYAGEIEDVISPERDPLDHGDPASAFACNTGARGGSRAAAALGAALLAAFFACRRRALPLQP